MGVVFADDLSASADDKKTVHVGLCIEALVGHEAEDRLGKIATLGSTDMYSYPLGNSIDDDNDRATEMFV